MKTIDMHNIFELDQQYKRTSCGFYKRMFLEDFMYYLKRNNAEDLIIFSNPTNTNGIIIDYFKSKLVEVINSSLEQLLFNGETQFVILENSFKEQEGNHELFDEKFLLYHIHSNIVIKWLNNYYYFYDKFKTYKISKNQVIRIVLSKIGYKNSFFKNPIATIDANHDFISSDNFIFSDVNHKTIYEDNDINQLMLTKDIGWNCRKYNSIISSPYYYYREERFYNIRVNIFKYIINEINKGLSILAGNNYEYIKISNKISELNLYNKYINKELTFNELKENLIRDMLI